MSFVQNFSSFLTCNNIHRRAMSPSQPPYYTDTNISADAPTNAGHLVRDVKRVVRPSPVPTTPPSHIIEHKNKMTHELDTHAHHVNKEQSITNLPDKVKQLHDAIKSLPPATGAKKSVRDSAHHASKGAIHALNDVHAAHMHLTKSKAEHKAAKDSTIDAHKAGKKEAASKVVQEMHAKEKLQTAAAVQNMAIEAVAAKSVHAAHAAAVSAPDGCDANAECAAKVKAIVDTAVDIKSHAANNCAQTSCDFLESTVLFGKLDKLDGIVDGSVCAGFAFSSKEGEMVPLAVHCKPLPSGSCPVRFDESQCVAVKLDVKDKHLDKIFSS